MFRISCPRCKAPANQAQLKVVGGTFEVRGVALMRDGFDLHESKSLSTDDELVRCAQCGETFPLGECLDEEGTEDPEPPKVRQYQVNLSCYRAYQGFVYVEATTPEEAGQKAKEQAGDVDWEDLGIPEWIAEGVDPVEVQNVEEEG